MEELLLSIDPIYSVIIIFVMLLSAYGAYSQGVRLSDWYFDFKKKKGGKNE